MIDRLPGPGLRTTIGVSGCAVLVALAGVLGDGLPAAGVQFKQVGHWVYNAVTGSAFHVDGGSKQVDGKVGPFDRDLAGSTIVQGGSRGYVVNGSAVTVFGKSTLSVDTTLSVGSAEQPEPLETLGGPYLVYQGSGRIVRLGVPPQTVEGGGRLADPVATEDGEVWVRRVERGELCRLPSGAGALDCVATVPAGHVGSLTVVGRRAAFLDLTAGTLATLGADGLGRPSRLPGALPADTRISRSAADSVLPMLDPAGRTLLLQSTAGLGARDLNAAVRVSLGAGTYGTPVSADGAVVVVDSSKGVLLTFTPAGVRKASVRLTGAASAAQVRRGDDGRVYVDDEKGAHTVVVDPDGSVTTVAVGGGDVPTETSTKRRPPAADKPRPTPDRPPAAGPRAGPTAGPTTGPATGPGTGGGRRPQPRDPAAPGAPGDLRARPSNGQLGLSWSPAAANGAPLQRYTVTWSGDGAASGTTTVPGNQRSTTLKGLTNGTTYAVTITAANRVGAGPTVSFPPATPTSEVPGTPAGVRAAATPDGGVDLTWTAPSGEGHTVTGYAITATGSDGSTVPAQSTAAGTSVTGLTPGVPYTFTVTAANELGRSSLPSDPSNAVTPYAPAEAPGGLAAAAHDASADLTWTEPALNGGELAGYVVSVDGTDQRVAGTTLHLDGLQNGRTYAVTVRATTRERGGSGPEVAGAPAQVSVVPGTVPTATVAAVPSGDRQITVTITVDDHQSGPVTCQVILNGAERWRGACAGAQAVPVGGLEYATTYDVYVQPSNSFGPGPVTNHASARTNDPPASISVSKGARVNRTDCTVAACAWVNVSMRGFRAGTSYSVSCVAPDGVYYSYNVRTDGAGNASVVNSGCYYGYSGRAVWVSAGGVESNHLVW